MIVIFLPLALAVTVVTVRAVAEYTCLIGHHPEYITGTAYVVCTRCPRVMNWLTGKVV